LPLGVFVSPMSWADLFDRTATLDVEVAEVRAALAARRDREAAEDD
jgi:hypothetical protein